MSKKKNITTTQLTIFFHEVLKRDTPNTMLGVILPDPPPGITKTGDIIFQVASHPTTFKNSIENILKDCVLSWSFVQGGAKKDHFEKGEVENLPLERSEQRKVKENEK